MNLDYTWQTLGTSTGATAFVLLATQYLKGYLPKWLPTRVFVLALSAITLSGAWAFGADAHSWNDLPILLLNAFPVALAAMGAYETALKKDPETPEPVAE